MSELNVAIIYHATPLATSPHSTDNWQWLINKHTKCLELFIYIFHDLVIIFFMLLQAFFTWTNLFLMHPLYYRMVTFSSRANSWDDGSSFSWEGIAIVYE